MTVVCQPQQRTAAVRAITGWRGRTPQLAIGDQVIAQDEVLDCGAPVGAVAVSDLLAAVEGFARLTDGTCHPPLAAVLYRVTGQPSVLDRCFPLVTVLDPAERAHFYQQVERVGRDPGLDLRLLGAERTDLTGRLPADARYIVAAHLVELFFHRPDLLAAFLSRPRHIRLYATPRAFAQDGGVSGGDYDPAARRLQLVLSRLYEGFYGEAPGVAPFVHELGHMLDDLEYGAGGSEQCVGLLPGLRRADGACFTPRARALFLAGKRLEAERYARCQRGGCADADAPVGHPYVFQSDGEFVAGHLELFLRTPHYFGARSPMLFDALVALFGQDPRRAREHDFAFYVEENRKAYAPGHAPLAAHGLTVFSD